jgi:hypothetical protein
MYAPAHPPPIAASHVPVSAPASSESSVAFPEFAEFLDA